MKKEINELIEISQFFGIKKEYVIEGGGNTSFKEKDLIWIKASGEKLGNISDKGFLKLSREKLNNISPVSAENQEDADKILNQKLIASIVDPNIKILPSTDTLLHNLMDFPFVVHTHPTRVNGFLCGKNSKRHFNELFNNEEALYLEYCDPGFSLFFKAENELNNYRITKRSEPKIIFVENHGIFVGAETIDKIKSIYDRIENAIKEKIKEEFLIEDLPLHEKAVHVLPAIRMLLSEDKIVTVGIRHNTLIARYYSDHNQFFKVSLPFIPDIIKHCRSKYMFIESEGTAEEIIERFKSQLERFVKEFDFLPKMIMIRDLGLIAVGENPDEVQISLDVYEDLMKISFYSENFGGPRFLSRDQIDYIDNLESNKFTDNNSNYVNKESLVDNKIIIVTGASHELSEAIGKEFFNKNANVVFSDNDSDKGIKITNELNSMGRENKAIYIPADVSDPDSVNNLVNETVKNFGGLDIFIVNTGIIMAGGINEIEPELFDHVTKLNYTSYYYCVKYASAIMKIQSTHRDNYYSDIIQINSHSGLRANGKNFADSGSKFGAVGLTQSFAMELIPNRIKVNAICPGNLFEATIWSDPKNGLFLQYLKTGKVPGAKTIDDVRHYYESQIPAGRSCRIEDIMKAILYVIDQEYETGQAIPVTGGQIMLN